MVFAFPERPAAERARARSVWQRFRSSGLVRERFGASWEPSGAPRTPKNAQERPNRQPKSPKSHLKSHRRRARDPQGRPRSDQGGPKERSERARELPRRRRERQNRRQGGRRGGKSRFRRKCSALEPARAPAPRTPPDRPQIGQESCPSGLSDPRATSSVDFGPSKAPRATSANDSGRLGHPWVAAGVASRSLGAHAPRSPSALSRKHLTLFRG